MIEKLSIKGFRSIKDAEIEFANPTFLLGRNGSGKSNIVDALEMLADCSHKQLQFAIDDHGGFTAIAYRLKPNSSQSNISIGCCFVREWNSGKFNFEITENEDGTVAVVSENLWIDKNNVDREAGYTRSPDGIVPNAPNDPTLTDTIKSMYPSIASDSLALLRLSDYFSYGLLKDFANIRSYAIDPSRVRAIQGPASGLILRKDGRNTASVIRNMERTNKDGLDQLCKFLDKIAPGTISVSSIQYGDRLSLEFQQQWGPGEIQRFEAFSMSDGTLRALGILTAIFQEPSPSVLIIEEPEMTIHPGALGVILDALQYASKRCQVIVTTHSPEVLDAKWIQPEHLRLIQWKDGVSQIVELPSHAKEAMRSHLMGAGELLRSNALEPEE